MTIALMKSAVLCDQSTDTALTSLFSLQADADNPAYLVLLVVNRNEDSSNSTLTAGEIVGDGAKVGITTKYGPLSYGAIVFARDQATGSYNNLTFGSLSQIQIGAPSADFINISVSLFASAQNPTTLIENSNPLAILDNSTLRYVGSSTLANTQLAAIRLSTVAIGEAATPHSVVAAAMSFVGDPWDDAGCWYLASQIAAEAGAGLPIQSIASYMPGNSNGEWLVAYDGTKGSQPSWASSLSAGEMIVFQNASGQGHIATIVAGKGANADVVDNYMCNVDGTIINAVGTTNQVYIANPHALADELAGVDPSSVVVYELDTPVVEAAFSRISLGKAAVSLDGAVAASDPAGLPIVAYQVYNSFGGLILSNGNTLRASSMTEAATLAAGQDWSIAGPVSATAGELFIRAYNGHYWGDWLTVPVVTKESGPAVFTLGASAAATLDGLLLGAQASNGTLASLAAQLKVSDAAIAISDTGGAIGGNLPALNALAASGHVTTIDVSDADLTFTLTATELTANQAALSRLDTTSLAGTIAITSGTSFAAPTGNFAFDLGALSTCTVTGANGTEAFLVPTGSLTIFVGGVSTSIDARLTAGIVLATPDSVLADYCVSLGNAANVVDLSGLVDSVQAGDGDNVIFLQPPPSGLAILKLGDGKNFVDFRGSGVLTGQLGSGDNAVLLEGATQTATIASGGSLCVLAAGDNDTISASAAFVTAFASGDGAVSFFGGQTNELTFVGGAGAATASGGSGRAVLWGGTGVSHFTAGLGGNSVLVGDAPDSELFGVTTGDLLYACTSGEVINAGGGNETLAGVSHESCFLGSGHEIVAVGLGSTITAGCGSATIFLSGVNNTIDVSQVAPGRQIDVVGFDSSAVQLRLGSGEKLTQLTDQAIPGGPSVFNLSDGSSIVFWGGSTQLQF